MSEMIDRLALTDKHRTMVNALLQEHAPGMEVWAYGSRVNGRGHAGSDLDLVLRSTNSDSLTADRMRAIVEAFRNSSIPFLVDVHDWSDLPDRFRSEIERNHVVLISGAH